jgi:hypothetical protein
MPPEENKLKIGIDPVFKGNPAQQTAPVNQNMAAGISNVLNNQKYVPGQTLDYSLPKTVKNNPLSPKSIVRTYKGDLETAIQANHLSSINIAIAENEKMHSQIKEQATEPAPAGEYSKNKIIIFVSAILIIIGIVALTFIIIKSSNQSPVIKVQELPSLITTESKDELNSSTVAKNAFVGTLSNKINTSNIPANNFYNVYITTGTSTGRRLVTASEFISLLGFSMPDIIKRTLLPDFMIGTYSFNQNLPFLILKTSYFENAYAGMLQWELNLEKDFRLLFKLNGYENALGILADLTPTSQKKFEDGVIVNKDVRLLRGDDGKIFFLYSIIDKETIIITVNDVAFKEIRDRLNKEKGLQR